MAKRLLCPALAVLLLLPACRPAPVALEISKRPVAQDALMRLMEQAKQRPPAAMTPAEHRSRRKHAIESFARRAEELDAEPRSLRRALELVTPEDSATQSLPSRVIRAPFTGKAGWIIVQNWGRPGRELSCAKVWVVGVRDQSILYAASLK